MSARALRLLARLCVGLFLAGPALALDCPPERPRANVPARIDPRHAHGLLWEITNAAGRKSWLYGTMHLADPRVTKLAKPVRAALREAKTFTMEMVLDLDTVLAISERMRYADGTLLADRIGAELFARTAELLAPYGVPAEAARKLKPWAAYTTLSLPPGEHATPLDMVLMSIAEKGGKPVHGLETLDEQTAVFETLGMPDQVQLLTEVVCHHEALHAEAERMIAAYVARDLAALVTLAADADSPAQRRLLANTLEARNARMVGRLRPDLEAGAAFVAVGALHLPGPDGLLARLEKAGYTVRVLY
ncbi:MAG: TraB/GumN family protein [Gammaproteobacteria bacterium]|nr:TraB/GumN family protein [Gammaproteobacteria bacterium]